MDAEARDISSAINTAITQTLFLDDPALTDPASGGTLTGSDLDLGQLKRKPTTVYLILPGRHADHGAVGCVAAQLARQASRKTMPSLADSRGASTDATTPPRSGSA